MYFFDNISSLRKKFLLGFISLNLLALALTTWVVSQKVRRAMDEQIETHIINAVQEQEDALEEELEMKWRWVNSKADTPFVVEAVSGSGELARNLGPFIRQLTPPGRGKGQTAIILLASSGRVIAERKADGFPVLDVKQAQWFSDVIEYGNPRAALVEGYGKPFFVFAAPVFVGERTAGVLVMEFGLYFQLDRSASEKATRASLLTPGGRVITGELSGEEAQRLAALSVEPDAPRIVKQNDIIYGIGAFNAPLEAGLGYLLVLSAPLEEVYRPVAALRWYIFSIGALIAALLAALVIWQSARLLKPLNELKSAMELIMRDASISMRVHVSTNDEIGALSTAFNLMLDSLDEKNRQLGESGAKLALLAGITSTSPLPIMLVDKDLRIQVWNNAAEKLFGWRQAEIIGQSPFATLVPEKEQEAIRRLRAKPGRAEPTRFETVRVAKSGTLIPVESISTQLTGSDGGLLGNIVVYRDLREIRALQASMLQAEKMGAVGQLAAGVAHEINNPLGVILGFAQGLVKRIKADDLMAMPLRSIEREAVRCKNLVQDLLVFSRSSKLEEELLDLNAVLTSALSLIVARAKTQGVELRWEMSPELPRIPANKNKLQQVLINLANNAMDAMPAGGSLTVGTSLSGERPGYVEIRVRDTGQGIPEAIQAKIMEPFFTTKPEGKGTGLGLSISYGIIQQHRGTIKVESREGEGTVFLIALPVRKEAPDEPA
ncbi:MAG TPA: hypothetical protein DCZ92_11755 [Elusimicrobia bacterium]|nr:hypothetical protein [Elusimicrobiota bacterium]